MDNENTVIELSNKNEKIIQNTIKEVYNNLKERGYDPTNQIVGYILSGDLGYISSYKGSRKKIANIERATLTEVLLKNFLA